MLSEKQKGLARLIKGALPTATSGSRVRQAQKACGKK